MAWLINPRPISRVQEFIDLCFWQICHYWHRRPHFFVKLTINDFTVILKRNEVIFIMANTTVGHKVTRSLTLVDTQGNPMVAQPAFDAPPVWTQTLGDPNVVNEDFTVSPDGTSEVSNQIAPGSDIVGVTVVVGGSSFSAQVLNTVSAAPQIVGGVMINEEVS